ncbi:unnamed protein product [Lactuca saligna]|uniref:Uncharacterized protein n=1 Tax=Lactuca saligna TaxID=75948 RepID=A0AA35YLK0_LACSI|nr:unnamed protein product [Lactuca saligna]
MVSTTRHMEISCARFWSIVVNCVLGHFKVLFVIDSIMEAIPTLQTSTFVISDPRNFTFISSIPEVMLVRVPSDNSIDDSESRTFTKDQEEGIIRTKEKNIATTSKPNPKEPHQKVSSPPSSYVPTVDISQPVNQDPIPILTTTPPSLPVTPPTLPITSTILISSISPLPLMLSIGISLPQISITLSSSIFTDSTTPTTSYVYTPLEDLIVKSFPEANRVLDIRVNASDVGENANVCVTSYQGAVTSRRANWHNLEVEG